jgi:Na+/H+-dicarboxylate symporter
VTIFENKYIDGEALADSWRDAIQKFVRDVNQAVQNATVNLVSLILTLVPYLIFLFIVLLAAKFGWKKIVQFWQK